MKHVVVFSENEIKRLLSGQLVYLIKFFKKRLDFLKELAVGDLVYFRKSKGEILGQFFIVKLIVIERLETGDWEGVKIYLRNSMTKAVFEEKLTENNILVIAQIKKLEQFITSPIEIPGKPRKGWIVLD